MKASSICRNIRNHNSWDFSMFCDNPLADDKIIFLRVSGKLWIGYEYQFIEKILSDKETTRKLKEKYMNF